MADTPKFQFWQFFFSPKGRVSRRAYAAFILPTTFSLILCRAFLRAATPHMPATTMVAITLGVSVLELLFLWPNFAVSAKRFRDFQWPGAIAAFHFVPLLTGFVYGITLVLVRSRHPETNLAPLHLAVIIVVWTVWASIVALSLIPGSKGTNRYGPPPRGPQPDIADAF